MDYTAEQFDSAADEWVVMDRPSGGIGPIVTEALAIAANVMRPGVIEFAIGQPAWREFPLDEDERHEVAEAIRADLRAMRLLVDDPTRTFLR